MTELIQLVPWGIIGILVYIIAYMLRNPDKVEGIGASLSRVLAPRSLSFDKTYVALDVQSKLNAYAKTVNAEPIAIMPYPARIEWVETVDRRTLIQNNEVIIRLDSHTDQEKNLVYSTVAYVSAGLLPRSRQYVDGSVMKSCDLVVASKILRQERKGNALEFFLSEFLDPIARENPVIKEDVGIMMELDDTGYFTTIFLRELWDVGRRLYPKKPSHEIREETRNLLEILERLVRKERGVDINPTLDGKTIRLSIVLIARPEVVSLRGIDPYTNYINRCLEKGIFTIHILAAGLLNVYVAKAVARHFENSVKIEKVQERKIPKNKLPEGIHILFKERIVRQV